jgi:uncharacterized OsmC-like protein
LPRTHNLEEAATMAIEGIDGEQIASFVKGYEESPSSFLLGLEARTIWEKRGLGNLGKIGPWSLGGQVISKPTRDFSVQIGSWREVGDALGVTSADDRIEPVEAALLGLASCVAEAIVLNCSRTDVPLTGLDVTAKADVDPGPIVGAKEPADWDRTLRQVTVDVAVRGYLSEHDKRIIEDGATRSPVRYLFGKTGLLQTTFSYSR